MVPRQGARSRSVIATIPDAGLLNGGRSSRPLSLPHAALPALFVVVDFLIILASAFGANIGYHGMFRGLPGDLGLSLGVGLVAGALFIATQHHVKLYRAIRTAPLRVHLKSATLSWIGTFAAFACLLFLLKMGDVISRGTLIIFFGSGLIGLLGWRVILKRLYRKLVQAGTIAGPRVVVLADPAQRDINLLLLRLERYGYSLSRLFLLKDSETVDERVSGETLRSTLDALVLHLRKQRIDEILVVASSKFILSDSASTLLSTLRLVPVPVKLIADPDLARTISFETCDVAAAKALLLKPAALSHTQRLVKRGADIAVSATLLFVLWPTFALIALAIKLDSSGPVFFRQWRGGYNHQRFRIFKFRTMRVQEDGAVIRQAVMDDPRVTRVGRFLRKTSIDELPQLINVLIGDMSIIGPRPHAIAHDLTYAKLIAPYPARFNVKPGITGWAQVNGCRGETAEVESMQRRVRHDISYIERWSLLLDLKILFLTVREVLRPKNAY